jgi:hypothetical protein
MLEAFAWFVALGVAAFLIAGTLAPLETMSWWAGRHIHPRRWRLPQARSPRSRSDQHYVIYIGGIDSLDGSVHT